MKKSLKIMIIFAICMLFALATNKVNASTVITATETTTTSTNAVVNWEYVLENNEIVALRCTNVASVTGELTIPNTIDGYIVRKLGRINYGDGIFEGCTGLTGITFPSSVTNIGYRAFYGCVGLKSLTVPGTITYIGKYAFDGCSGIKTLTLENGVIQIEEYAFEECNGFKTLTIPNTVTTIGEFAFDGCSGIKTLTLSENLTCINTGTFRNCSGLSSVIIPNNVTTIKGEYYSSGAFYSCTGLKKVLIPDSVATIEEYSFNKCSNLTIYGHDGETSKIFAETYGFSFDYIENWDTGTGTDVTAPTVESLKVVYSSVSNYYDDGAFKIPSGATMTINVNFSEEIKGTTAPTLTIQCGGENDIPLTNGQITGSKIVYTYTITANDEGTITAKSLTGGNVTDNAGNSAELTCPTLSVEYYSGYPIYANGAKTNIALTSISLPETKSVALGSTLTLTVTYNPTTATNKTVTWSSSDETIATVSDKGIVTPKKVGTVDITATSDDGAKTATCRVTVEEATQSETIAITSISLPESKTVEMGSTITLEVTYNPTNATNKNVTWKSSDETIATVSAKGVVTPKKAGTVNITATSEDGSKTATCKVIVTEKSTSTNSNSNSTTSTNTNSNNSNDSSTSTTTLPKTGINSRIILSIIFICGLGVVVYSKYNKLKEI